MKNKKHNKKYLKLTILPSKQMKFDKSQDSYWNVLFVYVNLQCILAGSKPQKKFFCFAFCLIKKTIFLN